MLVPTKANMKLANGNTRHAQGIGIVLGSFPNCPIIYTVRPVYYCPGHPLKKSDLVPSNLMLAFKRLHLNLLNIMIVLTLKVVLGDHPTIL